MFLRLMYNTGVFSTFFNSIMTFLSNIDLPELTGPVMTDNCGSDFRRLFIILISWILLKKSVDSCTSSKSRHLVKKDEVRSLHAAFHGVLETANILEIHDKPHKQRNTLLETLRVNSAEQTLINTYVANYTLHQVARPFVFGQYEFA